MSKRRTIYLGLYSRSLTKEGALLIVIAVELAVIALILAVKL